MKHAARLLVVVVVAGLLGGCTGVPYLGGGPADLVNAGAAEEPAAAPARPGTPAEVERDLALDVQTRRETAVRLLTEATELMRELRYEEAEERLVQALRNDPGNAEASRKLEETRFILGRLPAERGPNTRIFIETQRLQTQQAQAQVRRLFAEGERFMAQRKYDLALKRFNSVIEIDSSFPWYLDMPELVALARERAAQAQRMLEDVTAKERAERARDLQERADRERTQDLSYIRNQIAQLARRAREAYEAGEFEKAEALCGQILDDLDPSHEEARDLLERSRRMRHIFTEYRIYRDLVKNWDIVFRDVEEAAIPYQEVFRFPPRKVWEKLGTREISLEDRVAADESIENREIRRKLETVKINRISFEERPLREVLDYLSKISGISFVPNKAATDAIAGDAEGMKVNLPEVQGLSLQNILELVLADRGDSGYGYQIQNGAVVIGPKESLARTMFLEFYSIEEIATSHPDFPAPPISVRPEEEKEEGGGIADLSTEETAKQPKIGADQLVTLITQRILGGSEENGTVKHQSGKLVVRTTLENHGKIRRLLESLRKLSGVLVTVEARFLDLQDNMLEEIGVEIGGPVESGLEYPIPDVNGLGTSVASGYAFIDEGLRYEVRAANISAYSGVLGTQITPFNISPSGGMALQYSYLDDYQLEAILTMVSKTQKTRTLDAPRVISFDGQNSYTMVVDQIAYIKDVDVNQTGVSPVINPLIGSFRVGSILEIRPTVTYDRKYVILEVKPTTAQHIDSEFATLSLAQGFTIVQVELPVILLAQIKTTITVPDGGTVLLGGLKKLIEQEKSIGIPIINRIPILNILFGRRGQTRLRNSMFVMIKASIVIVKEEEKLNFP